MRKYTTPLTLGLGFGGVALAGFVVSANAARVASPDDGNLLDLSRPIFDEIMRGHYLAAVAFALVLAVALVKRYAPGKAGTWVHSDVGGSLTTLVMAFAGAIATATMGGAPWTWAMCWKALTIAFTAAGGYAVLKKLVVVPLLRPLYDHAPAWLKIPLGLVLWMFDKPTAVEAEATATAAGEAAVAAHPAAGTAAVVPPPTELP